MNPPVKVVVMGVAGAGKSTVAERLADRLGARYLDADAAHPAANVAKMARGEALTDDDRWPWLARLRQELRADGPVVVTCSALKRRYRDMLRHATGTRFVFLDLDEAAAFERVSARPGHFMGPGMVASQFAALERPSPDETDVAIVDAGRSVDAVVDAATLAIGHTRPGLPIAPLIADGDIDRCVSADDVATHIATLVERIAAGGARRVLLVPPDHTRLYSGAGVITAELFERLTANGVDVGVLPALGTHTPMSPQDVALMFASRIPFEQVRVHRWRDGLATLGEISAAEVSVLSGGSFELPIPVALDEVLVDGWDLVVSIGQVLPHEVIGMANFTKNLVIGLGGAPTIHRSHFLGALAGMERLMGRVQSPVRDAVDAAFDRFVAHTVPVLWVLTVMEATDEGVVQRGLFVGEGGSMASGGAAYRAAATLAQHVNLDIVDEPFERVVCWLDPSEFRTTWLGNKAIYRTRMAMADGGELVVLAPGVHRFGEDDQIDALIRRHGYRGAQATLAALDSDPELAVNLSAAAHLIHGSSEGRFRIVYCTDPSSGGLCRDEVESVGFEWRLLDAEMARLGVDGSSTGGVRHDSQGTSFVHIPNPALGLWATSDRFASGDASGALPSSAADHG